MRAPLAIVLATSAVMLAGCLPPPDEQQAGAEQRVWGGLGQGRGEFYKPRACALGPDQLLYVVDKTGRIQVFDEDGVYQRGWRTPEVKNGKPCGLSFDRDGHLIVADTHYFRVLRYTAQGELLADRTLGGVCGDGPGEFNFVTRAVEDSQGNLYVAEYGEQDRIQKFSPEGEFLLQWGRHGEGDGEFNRPQALVVDEEDHLWVADACNHRILVFDATTSDVKLLKKWGEEGEAAGQLRYPWDLLLAGPDVYVCEFGNHRIQKFTRDGVWQDSWGSAGREAGQLMQPWSIVRDDQGRLFVVDTYNHRVKRILF